MEQKEFGGKMLDIDEDGFIQDPEVWDEAVAVDLAKTEGAIPLMSTFPPFFKRIFAISSSPL